MVLVTYSHLCGWSLIPGKSCCFFIVFSSLLYIFWSAYKISNACSLLLGHVKQYTYTHLHHISFGSVVALSWNSNLTSHLYVQQCNVKYNTDSQLITKYKYKMEVNSDSSKLGLLADGDIGKLQTKLKVGKSFINSLCKILYPRHFIDYWRPLLNFKEAECHIYYYYHHCVFVVVLLLRAVFLVMNQFAIRC